MKIIMRLMLSLQPAQPQARGRARPGGNPNLRGSGVVALEDAALEFNAANPGDRHNFTPSRAMGGGARCVKVRSASSPLPCKGGHMHGPLEMPV